MRRPARKGARAVVPPAGQPDGWCAIAGTDASSNAATSSLVRIAVLWLNRSAPATEEEHLIRGGEPEGREPPPEDASSGAPRRMQGRDEIRRRLVPPVDAAARVGRRITRYEPVVVHETDDPEVGVVESDLQGEDAAGKPYRVPHMQIVRVHDGQIAVLRDYFDAGATTERREPGAH